MDIVEFSEKITAEIRRRAQLYVDDNLKNPTPSDYLIIQNAMLIGASIMLEQEAKDGKDEREKKEKGIS